MQTRARKKGHRSRVSFLKSKRLYHLACTPFQVRKALTWNSVPARWYFSLPASLRWKITNATWYYFMLTRYSDTASMSASLSLADTIFMAVYPGTGTSGAVFFQKVSTSAK